jgi:hypothetical protein
MEKELITKLADAYKEIDLLTRDIKQWKDRKFEFAVHDAIIADIVNRLYGSGAHGSPSIMSMVHCGFVCGLGGTKAEPSFVRSMYKAYKIFPNEQQEKELNEWEEFLNTLQKRDYKQKED